MDMVWDEKEEAIRVVLTEQEVENSKMHRRVDQVWDKIKAEQAIKELNEMVAKITGLMKRFPDKEVARFGAIEACEDDEKCSHIDTISLHSSIKIGGGVFGECTNKVLPGMTLCEDHADRDAMGYWIRNLSRRLAKYGNLRDGMIKTRENEIVELKDMSDIVSNPEDQRNIYASLDCDSSWLLYKGMNEVNSRCDELSRIVEELKSENAKLKDEVVDHWNERAILEVKCKKLMKGVR